MRLKICGLALASLALTACTEPGTGTGPEAGFVQTLPETVIAMAGPNQDLTAVRVEPDGCLWYRHKGVVETTMLPLRTGEGRPICTRAAAPQG